MKKVTFENIKDVRAWVKYGKTRLYLKVHGISAYQHKNGSVFLELRDGEWVSNKLGDEDMVRLANELNEAKIFDAKEVEEIFKERK